MNLRTLLDWTQIIQEGQKLRELVRRDAHGKPREGDVVRAMSLIREVRKRIQMVEDHQKKASRYMNDITEYLMTLDKWGVKYIAGTPAKDALIEEPKQAVEGPFVDPARKDPTPKTAPERKSK